MHLLNAQDVGADSDEAVDLAQSPGDIVVLSAAETELALLADARNGLNDTPTLRLANLLLLRHPMSVDLYVERVIAKAKLVVLRLLGGRGYWSYGVDEIAACCRQHKIPLACLPGDDNPDPELAECSTLDGEACRRLWLYLVHGGAENAAHFLAYSAALIGRDSLFEEPRPLLAAGVHRDLGEEGEPAIAIVFYRALVQSDLAAPIDALAATLADRGFRVRSIFATSLKDQQAAHVVSHLLNEVRPDLVFNATAFAISKLGDGGTSTLLDDGERPVLQLALSGERQSDWAAATRGLMPRDLAMNVALPEVDGRIFTRAIAFKEPGERDAATEITLSRAVAAPDRIAFVADLAAAWVRLRRTSAADRRIAIVLANYPNRDGRLANGVGLDTPESAVACLRALAGAGYRVQNMPADSAALMDRLREGPTNALEGRGRRTVRVSFGLDDYKTWFDALPITVKDAILERWGEPDNDPHVHERAFALSLLPLGNTVVGIQPSRGYHIDPDSTYHDPDLVPPHGYLAFYAWLRTAFDAHAVVHLGKHGNLEWLPGKSLALSEACFPEAVFGPTPQLYPFIVNDPGEGSQAKRRTSAVIVDHLTPPLARGGAQEAYSDLEHLVDEYADALRLDPRRADLLRQQILEQTQTLGLDSDLGLDRLDDEGSRLAAIDAHLCELKELQIRDGLHVFGASPTDDLRSELLVALARVPRGGGPGAASILKALADDLGLTGLDPLSRDYANAYVGPRPKLLASLAPGPWRTAGDTVERLEALALALVETRVSPDTAWARTNAVLREIDERLAPALDGSGPAELAGLLRGLDGKFLNPGPSGAPSRGRPDVLPTGRNFYSVDTRAVPTPAAWHLGWRSAQMIVDRHLQEEGDWPRAVALSAWGTANMRTGGDDLAQALALMGMRPRWDGASNRVIGTEVLPLDQLGRPRVDVTLRVSGFFRDAFPAQIALFDEAVQAVARLDEPAAQNPLAAKVRAEASALEADGVPPDQAFRTASYRLFGSKPGAYGAGLQALIDERGWAEDADLAQAFIAWGGWAYGSGDHVAAAPKTLEHRLGGVKMVLHNQDNREHDLLDSDDYYQFEGGLTAAVRVFSGAQPRVYHNDHSRPDHLKVRSLEEELSLIVRGRATNPKWIEGVMRHGYKGACEIAATVDYLFAFAATTHLVGDHLFDALWEAYLGDPKVKAFIQDTNPDALLEIEQRFEEARDRGFWHPRRNDFEGTGR